MSAGRLAVALGAAIAVSSVASPGRAQPAGPRRGETSFEPHLVLHATGTYGIGAWSAVGVQLEPLLELSCWDTDAATGSVDVGAVLGWQLEPEALQYEVPSTIDNEAHRANAWVVVGTSFHFGDRRSTLGVRLFGGWTHVWSAASLDDPRVGPLRRAQDDYGRPNVGGSLTFDLRLSDHVGLVVQASAPFPVGPSYVTTLFHVGLGLSVRPF